MNDTDNDRTGDAFAIQPTQAGRGIVPRLAALFLVPAMVVAMEWGSDLAVGILPVTVDAAFMTVLQQLQFPDGLPGLTDVDFTGAALAMLGHNTVQYGAVVLLALIAALLAGNADRRQFGIALGKRTLTQNILLGLGAGIITGFMSSLIFVAKDVFALGGETPFWWAMERTPWDWDFWLLMFVGSFGFVALVEEIAFRGGMLGRLAQSFAPGASLLGIAMLFAYMHDQYFALGLIGYITLGSVVISGIVFGYVFLRSGSLIPAVIAHAMINIPASMEVNIALCAAGLAGMILIRKPIGQAARRIVQTLIVWDTAIVLAWAGLLSGLFWINGRTEAVGGHLVESGLVALALLLSLASRFVTRGHRQAEQG